MKQITAIIERAEDGTYSVYCPDEIFSGMGDTINDAKADMTRQMAVYKETALKEGFRYPDFLDNEYTIEYTIDALSLMNYYVKAGIFTLAALEKITGINQKQLWAYTTGTKPRKAQADKIRSGFLRLSEDLATVFA